MYRESCKIFAGNANNWKKQSLRWSAWGRWGAAAGRQGAGPSAGVQGPSAGVQGGRGGAADRVGRQASVDRAAPRRPSKQPNRLLKTQPSQAPAAAN